MQTPYIALALEPDEEVAVEALLHGPLSVWFMVGRCEHKDGKILFEVKDIHQVLAALETLNSAQVEGGAANKLIRRIRRCYVESEV